MPQYNEMADLLIGADESDNTLPIWFVKPSETEFKQLSSMQAEWLRNSGWKAENGRYRLLPDEQGNLSGVVYCYAPDEDDPLKFGLLSKKLPSGTYQVKGNLKDPDVELLSWLLSQYRFDRYQKDSQEKRVSLQLPDDVDAKRLKVLGQSVCFGRDLINTPANDMGPDELEQVAQSLAKKHDAKITVVRGDDLLEQNFPLVHAVGRASPRAPRVIDIVWGQQDHPTITLVGKGICFDTGGLNIKPGVGMSLMKKDMGGAAAVLTLANMIMELRLPIRLRVIISAAENSVAGNAFRPGDVLPSRNGITVEIANTDAEGRLVLADALALAEEDSSQHLITFATLTGAARVALGVDLPPFYTTDDDFAEHLSRISMKVGDPLWRMPFWKGYEKQLKSHIADINHISESMFAGSITAALFLKRFVKKSTTYSHFDIYGWVPSNKSGKTKGGEPQGARAVFEVLEQKYGK